MQRPDGQADTSGTETILKDRVPTPQRDGGARGEPVRRQDIPDAGSEMANDRDVTWINAEKFAEILQVNNFQLDAEFVRAMAQVGDPIPTPRWAGGKPLWPEHEAHAWARALHMARRA